MPISTSAIHHVRLTVTDLARSRAFYEQVFGWPVAYELPAGADEATVARYWFLFGGVIYAFGDSMVGLRPVGSETFAEDRTGLDHVSFAVDSLADLEAAAATLEGLGIEHSGVKDVVVAHLLEFRDPDNIALELYALKPGQRGW
jgi:glyoxylase I family protein